MLKKKILVIFCFGWQFSFGTMINVKTIGATYDADTTYANIGDTIHFIIGIGHDLKEITGGGYTSNTMILFPGGFNYPNGIFDYVVDSAKTYYFGCSYHMASDQMKGVLIVSDPLSSAEMEREFAFNLYPNPVENFLTVSSNEDFNRSTFEIFTIGGKLIYTGNLRTSIDLTFLQRGGYLLAIRKDDILFSRVLMKK